MGTTLAPQRLADARAEISRLTAERDALARQVASCRRALEWLWAVGITVSVPCAGHEPYACLGFNCQRQGAKKFYGYIAAATGVPLADLTGEAAQEQTP